MTRLAADNLSLRDSCLAMQLRSSKKSGESIKMSQPGPPSRSSSSCKFNPFQDPPGAPIRDHSLQKVLGIDTKAFRVKTPEWQGKKTTSTKISRASSNRGIA